MLGHEVEGIRSKEMNPLHNKYTPVVWVWLMDESVQEMDVVMAEVVH